MTSSSSLSHYASALYRAWRKRQIIVARPLVVLLPLSLLADASSAQAQCSSEVSDSYWKIGPTWGSSRLANCDNNQIYNCHKYTMVYFENGCTAGNINTFNCPQALGVGSETDYQSTSNPKYVQVCNEPEANITYWWFPTGYGGPHSAVRIGFGSQYRSKYGPGGPLVQHVLGGSYYDHACGAPTQTSYWAYVGAVAGPSTISGTTPVTYSLFNRPGVTYQWSILTGWDHISISGAANQASVTVQPVHRGSAVLRLTVSSPCGAAKTRDIPITVGNVTCGEALYSVGGGTQNKSVRTTNAVPTGLITATAFCEGSSTIAWTRTSGSITQVNINNPTVSFTMPSSGSVSFNLRTVQGGVTTNRSRTFYNYGSFRMSSDPSTNDLAIDLNPDLDFTIELVDAKSGDRQVMNSRKTGSRIPNEYLKQGEYAIRIYYNGELLDTQQLRVGAGK